MQIECAWQINYVLARDARTHNNIIWWYLAMFGMYGLVPVHCFQLRVGNIEWSECVKKLSYVVCQVAPQEFGKDASWAEWTASLINFLFLAPYLVLLIEDKPPAHSFTFLHDATHFQSCAVQVFSCMASVYLEKLLKPKYAERTLLLELASKYAKDVCSWLLLIFVDHVNQILGRLAIFVLVLLGMLQAMMQET